MSEPRCAVVYLARKVDGMRWLPRFLVSLQAKPAGRDYDLIVILKGYAERECPACLKDFRAPGLGVVLTTNFDDRRFAIEAFFTTAERFDYTAFLFFVSSARILAPGWARIMFGTLFNGDTRLVGGSASFESLEASTPFPNPAVRTNGFAIRRSDWLAIERGDLLVRYGDNLVEAGPRSLTKQIQQRGGGVLLVDREGRSFPPGTWPESSTFRLSRQQGLLFSDNRTTQFDVAKPDKRRRLAEMAWGPGVPVVPVSIATVHFRRIKVSLERLWWRCVGRWLIAR